MGFGFCHIMYFDVAYVVPVGSDIRRDAALVNIFLQRLRGAGFGNPTDIIRGHVDLPACEPFRPPSGSTPHCEQSVT